MRKYVWLVGILVIAMVAVMFVAGCGGKKQSVVTANSSNGAPAGEGANTLGGLLKRSSAITSYVMITEAGPMKTRTAMKMADGKPVAMKMDTEQGGWMIIRLDKKMHYMYNPATKYVMAMQISGSSSPSSRPAGVPDAANLKALAGMKTSSDTIDGVECTKVTSVDGANTYWFEKENGLPVQSMVGGQTMKFKYEDINAVPDSEFEVPAGLKTMKMSDMPGMPKMPK